MRVARSDARDPRSERLAEQGWKWSMTIPGRCRDHLPMMCWRVDGVELGDGVGAGWVRVTVATVSAAGIDLERPTRMVMPQRPAMPGLPIKAGPQGLF